MPVMRDTLRALLRPYGLEELADAAVNRFTDGMPTGSELELWLEEQPIVQREFSAVFERRSRGLPPVSISDVVAYRQRAGELAAYYDLPPGFIDPNRLIVEDVSINELGERVQTAADVIQNRPDVVQQMTTIYGLSAGDAIAFALDPDTGLAAVQRRFAAARVATQATRQAGLQLTAGEAEGLVGQGVDEGAADQGFATLGRFSQVTGRLEGDADPGMSREAQLGIVAGQQASQAQLQRRQRGRQSVFEESGSASVNADGVLSAGRAT